MQAYWPEGDGIERESVSYAYLCLAPDCFVKHESCPAQPSLPAADATAKILLHDPTIFRSLSHLHSCVPRPRGAGDPAAEYAARRDSLAAHIDSGVVIAFGAPDPVGIRRWTQLPAFRYLTGFLEPNAALVLVKRGGSRERHPVHRLARSAAGALRRLPAGLRHRGAGDRALRSARCPRCARWWTRWWRSGLPVYDLRDFATADAATQDTLTRGARFMADLVARNPELVVQRRCIRRGQPATAEEPGRAGAASPGHRRHGGVAQRGPALGQARHVGVPAGGADRGRLPPDRLRRARVRLDRRLGTQLDPVPLQRPTTAGWRRATWWSWTSAPRAAAMRPTSPAPFR